jgi:hypothetical protein
MKKKLIKIDFFNFMTLNEVIRENLTTYNYEGKLTLTFGKF